MTLQRPNSRGRRPTCWHRRNAIRARVRAIACLSGQVGSSPAWRSHRMRLVSGWTAEPERNAVVMSASAGCTDSTLASSMPAGHRAFRAEARDRGNAGPLRSQARARQLGARADQPVRDQAWDDPGQPSGVGGVASGKTPRLLEQAEQPLQADGLHPAWRSPDLSGDQVQTAAGSDRDRDSQLVAVAVDPELLLRMTERYDQDVGLRSVHESDDGVVVHGVELHQGRLVDTGDPKRRMASQEC